MSKAPIIFQKEGYPIVRLFDEYFEVKAIDYWEFRSFNFSDITKIEYYNLNDRWWMKLIYLGSWRVFFEDQEPSILKITKKNGGNWKYKCPNPMSREFNNLVRLLNKITNANN